MPAQNRILRNTRPRSGLRPLAWGLALLAGAQGLAAQVPVIEPGSAAGPTVFEDVPSSPEGSCEPNLAVPSVLHDNYGNPIGQVGCLASGISPIPPGFPDKLQAAALSLIPVGPTLFRGKTFKSYDFEISASSSGRASAIPALITAQIDIQGLLAALLEGRAEVEVSIDVLDITGGAGQAELVVSQKIYENRIGGSFEAGVSAGLGGSLPEPSAEVGVGASIAIGGEIKMVHDTESIQLPVLVQRGHTYRMQINFESRAGVGVGGGLGLASFYGPSAASLWDLMDFRDPREALRSTADLLTPGALDTSISGPQVIIPRIEIPGFSIDPVTATIPRVWGQVPEASVVFAGAEANYSVDLPQWVNDGVTAHSGVADYSIPYSGCASWSITVAGTGYSGCEGFSGSSSVNLPDWVNNGITGRTAISDDPSGSLGASGGGSFTTPRVDFEVSSEIITAPGPPPISVPAIEQQILNLDPLFDDVAGLADRLNLPSFEAGLDGHLVLDWIQPLIENAAALSPLLQNLLTGPGVEIASLSVTVEEDIFEIGGTITSRVGDAQTAVLDTVSHARSALVVESLTLTMEEDVSQMGQQITETTGDSQAAIVASVGDARSDLLQRVDEVRESLETNIVDSSDALSAQILDRSAQLGTQLDEWATLNLRTKIEANLAASGQSPVATFALPAAAPFYGHLEETRQIVVETMDRMSQAGQPIFNAEDELADGDQAYATQEYLDAYSHYRKAYSAAVR